MNNTHPLVSIIMPSYNASRFIGRAIESVLAQSYPHWELIIVDDASTDNTPAVVRAWVEECQSSRHAKTRIHYHRVTRIGHPSGVRNYGLRLASGELIAFLDADDLYYPDALEKLVQALQEDSQRIAVYGFAFHVDEEERPLPQPNISPNYSHDWVQIVTCQTSCMLSALMFHRHLLDEIGYFNESLGGVEDYEFYVRLFLYDQNRVAFINHYIYQYRIHQASLTKAPDHCERVLVICLRIMKWLFSETNIPPHIHAYRSKSYIACYRYLARERLLNRQPHLARWIAFKAFQDRNVHILDSLRQCGPLLIRSYLPMRINDSLVKYRAQISGALRPKPTEHLSTPLG